MKNSEDATKEFMEKLKNGKFKREPCPNPPPYYDEDNEMTIEEYKKFLESDISKTIFNL